MEKEAVRATRISKRWASEEQWRAKRQVIEVSKIVEGTHNLKLDWEEHIKLDDLVQVWGGELCHGD